MSNSDNQDYGDPDSITNQVKTTARAASDEVKSRAGDMVDTVTTEAGNYATEAKVAAADGVKDVASALRTAADDMRSGSAQERTFSQIADGLADASDAMRDKDLGEIVGVINDFAKRNPLVFLGSAALIGFAATRFAKASGDGASQSSDFSSSVSANRMKQPRESYGTSGGNNMAQTTPPTPKTGAPT